MLGLSRKKKTTMDEELDELVAKIKSGSIDYIGFHHSDGLIYRPLKSNSKLCVLVNHARETDQVKKITEAITEDRRNKFEKKVEEIKEGFSLKDSDIKEARMLAKIIGKNTKKLNLELVDLSYKIGLEKIFKEVIGGIEESEEYECGTLLINAIKILHLYGNGDKNGEVTFKRLNDAIEKGRKSLNEKIAKEAIKSIEESNDEHEKILQMMKVSENDFPVKDIIDAIKKSSKDLNRNIKCGSEKTSPGDMKLLADFLDIIAMNASLLNSPAEKNQINRKGKGEL